MVRPYTVRESPRAKHARLRVTAREGLLVIIPKGFDRARVPDLLERKQEWLRRTENRLADQRKFLEPDRSAERPERLSLRAIGEEWWIDYRVTDAGSVTAVEREGNRLLVYGDVDDTTAATAAVKRWVSRKAHEHLVPWLARVAGERAFAVSRITVHCQRTRWASCSPSGTISLNLKLMFLPEHLVRYVLLHELAHTRVMNHSREFWGLVHLLEPSYGELDAELRTAWRLVPSWLLPGHLAGAPTDG